MNRDGQIDVATSYSLEDPRLESRQGQEYVCSPNVQTGSGARPASYQWAQDPFFGVKRAAGARIWPLTSI